MSLDTRTRRSLPALFSICLFASSCASGLLPLPTVVVERGGVLPPGVAAPVASNTAVSDTAAARTAPARDDTTADVGATVSDRSAWDPAPRAAQAVVGVALDFVGTPYRLGGADPSGFDCSGLTRYVYLEQGIALPRTVHEQFDMGRPVALDEVRPGDLLFFATQGRGASHVGIALGDGSFVHAPNSRGGVRVEALAGRYWTNRLLGARRIIR